MDNEEIGATAKELDGQEIIYRIRLGRRTMIRICVAVLVWIVAIFLMWRVF